ncbi:MAG: exo-alpha-sialidase [Opitutae bacterium]|nr:exo-alpha-sialidase [Opitutae bacterium]
MKKLLWFGALLVALSSSLLPAAPLFETVTVHAATPGNRPNYRIPALATAPNGDLLLFTEKRNDGIGDLGNHDLMLVRSSDCGRTWSAEQVIFDDGDNTCTDSTVCIDRERGRIFLFFLRNKSQFAYFTSDDSGKTWRGPVSIHAAVTRREWEQEEPTARPGNEKAGKQRYGVGPGAGGIQLTQGPKKGRLLVPARHRATIGDGKTASFSHVFSSDDHGETWQLGPTVAMHGNECRLEELSDGTVMLNMRNGNTADQPDNSRRLVALSTDGGDTWPTVYRDEALVSTTVHAGLRRYVHPGSEQGRLLLFSNPASPIRQKEHPYGRYNLTVRWSRDDGQTWSAGRVIYPHPSSYTDLTILSDGTIGLVYERGPKDSVRYWDEIQFARFNLEWLFAPPHTRIK